LRREQLQGIEECTQFGKKYSRTSKARYGSRREDGGVEIDLSEVAAMTVSVI